jgi:hypothetical protein
MKMRRIFGRALVLSVAATLAAGAAAIGSSFPAAARVTKIDAFTFKQSVKPLEAKKKGKAKAKKKKQGVPK